MSSACSWSISLYPMMALSGVRSSWLMFARNWLLAWLATSAPSFAATSSSSARLRSVTSFCRPTKWVTLPASSLTGAIVRSFQNGVPSFR